MTKQSKQKQALTGAGIGVGVQAFLDDVAEQLCRSNAARQQLYSAAKMSVLAGKIAAKLSKGSGLVGLALSIGGSSHCLVAVVNGTANSSDYLNSISIISSAVGVGCAFSEVGLPIPLICDGISVDCSISAELVEQ